jgi:hypothetical protein
MDNDVKEGSSSDVQPVTVNSKSYKTHFIVTLIILIGLVIYFFFLFKGSQRFATKP